MTTALIAMCAMLSICAVSFIVIQSQQQTIKDLSNKLMTLSGHREYTPQQKPSEPVEYRQPMSFFDDPSVPLENHRHSLPNSAEDIDDEEGYN